MGTGILQAGASILALYLNDKMLYEAESLEACIRAEASVYSWEPEASLYKWYAEQDGDETVIYANFQGKNPNQECVEINVRRECFMPSKTGVDYITVSGFRIEKRRQPGRRRRRIRTG